MKPADQLRAENQAIRDVLATGPEAELRSIPGIIHVSIGLKETGGRATDRLCVRVYVQAKKAASDLPPSQLIPREIQGVPTDVLMLPASFQFQGDNAKYRPIKGGIQITNRIIDVNDAGTGTQMPAGALGCVAVDKTNNAPVILSNWHVLTGNGARNGDKIFQPAPTNLPPLSLADLPFHPTDDENKVAVLRRSSVTNKVDGAIAAIDVSSCCHCCGIHYSNEINGLSVSGRPARNTIVGDEPAVSGLSVFKVGPSTLRTEGVIVDANYPSFSMTRSGTTYTFDGQIAINNLDSTKPFSLHGDSGSALISINNKIVGLLFAAGSGAGGTPPYVSLANHIGDVFTELNIKIDYSQDVVTISGPVREAPIPEPYRALRDRMESNPNTSILVELGGRHREEIVSLVNHRRPVIVAWRHSQGPAWLATLMSAVREGRTELPAQIQGVTLEQGLRRMRDVLMENGSAELRASLSQADADRILAASSKYAHNWNELIESLAAASGDAAFAR